tara:strand:+ start:271 stop:822 length:552 start_codon:yes stop_codon:yes gene_type:complete
MDLEEFYKIYINNSNEKGWNYIYSKKMVKKKVDKINTLREQINKEQTIDGKILLDEEIKKIFGEFDTEPILKKGIERTNKGKIVERVKIIQKQQRGNFTPLHPSPLRKERVIGGKTKRRRRRRKRKSRKKRTKSLFKKKRTKKKRKRVKRSSKKMYRKCAKFFTKKHKLTQKKALNMCKVMFG